MDELDPKLTKEEMTEAWALVGEFMYFFALSEFALDDFIEASLRINPLESLILLPHLNLNAKCSIARTLLDWLKHALPEQEWKAADAAVKDLMSLADNERNTIAHAAAYPVRGGLDVDRRPKMRTAFRVADKILMTKDEFNASKTRMFEIMTPLRVVTMTVQRIMKETHGDGLQGLIALKKIRPPDPTAS